MQYSLSLLALAASVSAIALNTRDTTCNAGPILTLNGRVCTEECGTDHPGGDYKSLPAANLQACINACVSDSKCTTAQYAISSSYCYLKSQTNPATANPNTNGVVCQNNILAVLPCVNSTVIVNGRIGTQECGVDHPGGNYANQYAASLSACEQVCAADSKCTTAQYDLANMNCYLKSTTNPGTSNPDVNGIVFAATPVTISAPSLPLPTGLPTGLPAAPPAGLPAAPLPGLGGSLPF